MCRWCITHGDGKIWYKNAKNYARRMYVRSRAERRSKSRSEGDNAIMGMLRDAAKKYGSDKWKVMQKMADKFFHTAHFGQVIPLEDAKIILSSISWPIGKMSCVCLRRHRGMEGITDKEKTHCCIGLGVGMYKWERFPEMYKGGVEFLSSNEAIQMLEQVNQKGLVHSIWTFGTPYLGGLCNCEYPICLGLKGRLDYDIKILIKGEYVAFIDHQKCNGCKICMTRCQFGAIKYSPALEKCYIAAWNCYGCGLCQTKCKRDAIDLKVRSKIPALKDVW
ncbi:MAG: 4Fe-4S binding protein [Candidatus Helarchaeota archaeon]|nr:4Fe-4S binding protein [Candidatus Helarchaeota archaeon]